MSRYIDADALTWLVEEYKLAISPITEEQERDNRLPLQMLTEFENIIAEQPTVDAVQVVRCKDCKWAEVDAWWTYCKLGHKEDTTNSIIYTCTHDFYCADGERKDGETEQCNTYSLGKIEMPKGAIEQIIADGERRTDGE